MRFLCFEMRCFGCAMTKKAVRGGSLCDQSVRQAERIPSAADLPGTWEDSAKPESGDWKRESVALRSGGVNAPNALSAPI